MHTVGDFNLRTTHCCLFLTKTQTGKFALRAQVLARAAASSNSASGCARAGLPFELAAHVDKLVRSRIIIAYNACVTYPNTLLQRQIRA